MLRPERLGSRVRGERSWLQPHPVRLTTPVSPERPTLRAEPSPGLDYTERTLLQQPRLPGLASPTRRRAVVCVREGGRGMETVRISQRKGRLDAAWLQVELWTESPAPLLTTSILRPGARTKEVPAGATPGEAQPSALVSPPPQLL